MDTCEPCFTTTGSLRGAKASNNVMDPCHKSIPLVCCRSQPRLPTFVISEHLELGTAGRVLGTADEVVLPPTRPQRRRDRKRAASVHAPWGGALGRGAADPPGSTWLT